MYTGKKKTIDAVQRLRLTFPAVIFFLSQLVESMHLYVHKRGEVVDFYK